MKLPEITFNYYGRFVDKNGIHNVDAKISAVKDFPTLKSTNPVRFFPRS